jgi:signal transduction histidine kinase
VYLEQIQSQLSDPALLEYLKIMINITEEIHSQIEFTRIYELLGSHEPQWVHLETVMPYSSLPDSVTLTANISDVYLFADPMLEKIFFSLLDNSIRHGQRVTEIRVTADEYEAGLAVIWEDNGIGVANEEKELIFEHGFGNNTGFGLFLLREILSLTDITIIETGRSGKGVRFEMMVPKGAYRIKS